MGNKFTNEHRLFQTRSNDLVLDVILQSDEFLKTDTTKVEYGWLNITNRTREYFTLRRDVYHSIGFI